MHNSPASGIAEANSLAKTAVIVAGPALIALIPMAAAPAMPAMAAHFAGDGHGPLFAQMVMTIPAVLLIVSATLTGILAEIVGRRTVLLWALLLFALAGAAALVAPNANMLIASRLVLGLAGGAVLTSSFSLAGDYPEAHRERVLGYAGAAAAIAAIIALTLGGTLVDQFGWRGPFVLYLASLPVLALAWSAVKHHRHEKHEHGLFSPIRLLWPFYLLTIVLVIGVFLPGIQGPFLLQEQGVQSAAQQGTIIAASSLFAALASASFGFLRRFLSIGALMVITALSMGLGCTLVFVLHGVAAMAVSFALIGIGAGLVEPVTLSIVLSKAPKAMQPRAVGMLLSAVFLGQFLNPLVLNPIREGYGISHAFLTVGVAFIALSLVLGLRHLATRARGANTVGGTAS
jgi:MFS family permease